MNSDVAAARLDVALEVILLRGVEHVAGCTEENHRAVACEILRRERRRVLGGVDGEPVLLSEFSNGGETDADGAVSESGGFGEDEDARLLTGSGDGRGER